MLNLNIYRSIGTRAFWFSMWLEKEHPLIISSLPLKPYGPSFDRSLPFPSHWKTQAKSTSNHVGMDWLFWHHCHNVCLMFCFRMHRRGVLIGLAVGKMQWKNETWFEYVCYDCFGFSQWILKNWGDHLLSNKSKTRWELLRHFFLNLW